MQSCLPSSLYSIIRRSQHTDAVHNGYSMTSVNAEKEKLCGGAEVKQILVEQPKVVLWP